MTDKTLSQAVAEALASRRFKPVYATITVKVDGVDLECDLDEERNVEAVRIGGVEVGTLLNTVSGGGDRWWRYLDAVILSQAALEAENACVDSIDINRVQQRIAQRHYESLARAAAAAKRQAGLSWPTCCTLFPTTPLCPMASAAAKNLAWLNALR